MLKFMLKKPKQKTQTKPKNNNTVLKNEKQWILF